MIILIQELSTAARYNVATSTAQYSACLISPPHPQLFVTDLPLNATEDGIRAFFARHALEDYPLAVNVTHNLALTLPITQVRCVQSRKAAWQKLLCCLFQFSRQ